MAYENKAELKIYESKAHNVKQRARMKILWKRFAEIFSGADDSEELYKLLENLYSEKHRFYHNLGHIKSLFVLFERFENLIEDKCVVFFSIWFHDSIYDPQAKDNEKRSAKLAVECLRKTSLPKNKISKIEKIILATEKHAATTLDSDGRLFLDFDLTILGTENEIYDEYAKAIRREYDFFRDEDYKKGRKKILQNFLEREFIYLTKEMREKFEIKARQNIEREILELQKIRDL